MQTITTRSDLSDLTLKTEYRTGEDDLVASFYRPCLRRATSYDRAVGYFRSTVFQLIGGALVQFARHGGKLRFICSPELTSDDQTALAEGYARRDEIVAAAMTREVTRMLAMAEWQESATTLATLVATGVLDVRIAIRPSPHGIYHEKLGIFVDALGNAVTFKGSSNETWSGWHYWGNLESIEVFTSWRAGIDSERVATHRAYFERLWAGENPHVDVIPFPEAAKRQLCSIARSTLDDLPLDGLPLPSDGAAGRVPLPYQKAALANWIAAGERGILQHATGSGKTLTALLALRRHLANRGPALVLVPSRILIDQWASEIRAELPDAQILLAGAGHSTWSRPLRVSSFTANDQSLGPRIVLATMQTAAKPDFLSRVSGGSHLMIVADEVHRIGSKGLSGCLTLHTGPRLGLSATPIRYGDPEGTARILDYFGPVVDPIVTLADAVRAGRLVSYEYFPHPIELTADEARDWQSLTADIVRESARQRTRKRDENDERGVDRLKLLFIKRARIGKKARNKLALAERVMTTHFESGQRWLVYCEDRAQLTAVLDALQARGLPVSSYYTDMAGDPVATLRWLERFGGILVSIRCLDEGVDIPVVSHALILASSQNPRQFIQRRGRVLRRAPGKYGAVIHDALVVPPVDTSSDSHTAMTRSELARALEFASSAINHDAAEEIADIAARLDITLTALTEDGIEDDDDDQE